MTGTSSWIQVNCSSYTLFAIKTDNTLWAAGLASNSILSGYANESSPVQVGASNWLQISVGSAAALGILSDNTLWVWGYNSAGEFGTNDPPLKQRPSPIKVGGNPPTLSSPVQIGTSSWIQVASGGTFIVGIHK